MPFHPYHWFREFSQHECDRRRWPKQIKAWQGPIKEAYVPETGSPVVLDITNREDMYKIKDLNLSKMIGVATQGSDGEWSGQHNHPAYPQSNVYATGPFSSLEAVTEAIRQSYVATCAEEARIAASPTLQLERILRNRDWTSHMSDDFRYWAAGEANDRQLKAILPKVPVEDVRRLWAEYAPSDIPCPV